MVALRFGRPIDRCADEFPGSQALNGPFASFSYTPQTITAVATLAGWRIGIRGRFDATPEDTLLDSPIIFFEIRDAGGGLVLSVAGIKGITARDPESQNFDRALQTLLSTGIVVFGSPGRDILVGNDSSDVRYGEGSDDHVIGGFGNDRIVGGDGNDRLPGAAGNDYLVGQGGSDVLLGGDGNDVLKRAVMMTAFSGKAGQIR